MIFNNSLSIDDSAKVKLEKNIENIKDLNIKYDITNNNFIGIVYYK